MAMVELDPDVALGELVTEHPPIASRLELLGLDYCCGGQRSLRDAVAAADLDLGDVMAALAAVDTDAPREGWAELGPAELVDHIEATHHAYLHEALPRLQALAAKVEAVHAGRHPELGQVARLVVAIRADLEPHLQKEEQVLFPMIRQLAAATAAPTFHCGTVANPITVMLQEHDRAGELLAQLRAATSGFEVPADGCASYRALYDGLAELEADTHLHVHKENNVLFPAVLELEASLGALDAP